MILNYQARLTGLIPFSNVIVVSGHDYGHKQFGRGRGRGCGFGHGRGHDHQISPTLKGNVTTRRWRKKGEIKRKYDGLGLKVLVTDVE